MEEEKTDIDITKAEFSSLSGGASGNQDEVSGYEELAVFESGLSGSRPVHRQDVAAQGAEVGTSGKTVKPKDYLAMENRAPSSTIAA